MNVRLLIARCGRYRRQNTAETRTIMDKDFITEDNPYLEKLIQDLNKQQNRTNFPSD